MSEPETAQPHIKAGAGVIPFSTSHGKVRFLFQTVFSGRKTGYLNDFGGGLGEGEDYRAAAIREFVEETETMYFADDVTRVWRSRERIENQLPLVAKLFEQSLSAQPDWWCNRLSSDPQRPKRWKTFFIEFPYRDVEVLNREWEADVVGRFKKRRQLLWISGDELLQLYRHEPKRLWKRVRQLENAVEVVDTIRRSKER
jgi:hypothetical protein